MKIGIMSDTHDRLENIDKFIEKFNHEGIEALFHCGDFCSPFVARNFSKLREGIVFHAVRGNNDGDIVHLNRTFSNIGEISDGSKVIEFAGKKILMLHGHALPEHQIMDIAKAGSFDIIMYGHYHHICQEQVGGKTLLLNPGESCGYLSGHSTAMIVDIEEDGKTQVEMLEI